MMKKNKTEFLILKCLVLENKIKELEERISKLEEKQFVFSPQEINIKPLPTPENTDIKDFHLCANINDSYDNLE